MWKKYSVLNLCNKMCSVYAISQSMNNIAGYVVVESKASHRNAILECTTHETFLFWCVAPNLVHIGECGLWGKCFSEYEGIGEGGRGPLFQRRFSHGEHSLRWGQGHDATRSVWSGSRYRILRRRFSWMKYQYFGKNPPLAHSKWMDLDREHNLMTPCCPGASYQIWSISVG